MDALLWKRIGDLFEAARQLKGEERAEFLCEQCGDDRPLHEQVLSLLNADDLQGPLDSRPTISNLPVPDVVAGRFRIVRYIAEGGMGTVYEAEDLQLYEHVALKTIRPEIALDTRAIERFKREILLGKSVTHPNVCRIHDLVVDHSDTGAEVLYLSMQYLDGETLASRIKRGPVTTAEALPLIEDMANGLSAAHAAAVVHRDFKSGNVILVTRPDRAHAVITDFGLARPIRDNDLRSLTRMAGTIEYMAPEQIRGEEVTAAADIYALGIVMYEMVTGQRPFTGDSKWAIADKHLHDQPQPPRNLAPELNANWSGAILDCLRKVPGDRFQSATDVKAALIQNDASRGSTLRRHIKSSISVRLIALSLASALALAVLGAIPSVRHKVEEWLHIGSVPHVGQLAVLPLMVPTDDPQATALEYGLADTLATRMTKLAATHPLQIVPASEIRAKGVTSLDQARQEFGVNLGLELSLRRSGDMVRVNYHLVDAKTHHEIRGDTITAPISDGFAIEDRVADSVVKALELDLQPEERQLLGEHGTQQSAAYDLYLQGRGYLEEYQKPENIESAITVFGHAIERDPRYALAFAGLGEAYWRKYELSKDTAVAELARKNCETGASIGEHQADTHICLGLIDGGMGHYADAIKQYQLALSLEPANDTAIRGLASAYQALGNPAEAEKTYKSAIALRPKYWLGYNELGKLYMVTGRYREAAEMFTQVTQLAPDSFRGFSNLGGAYVALSRNSDAVVAFKRSIEIRPTYAAYSNLGTALFLLRQYQSAAESYKAALTLSDQDYVVWGNLSDAYRFAGKNAEAEEASKNAITLALARLDVNPLDPPIHADLAMYYAAIGKRDEALEHLRKALEESSYRDPELIFDAAVVYHDVGERDQAIKWVGRALAAGYSPAAALNAPSLEDLNSDPRFRSLFTVASNGHN